MLRFERITSDSELVRLSTDRAQEAKGGQLRPTRTSSAVGGR